MYLYQHVNILIYICMYINKKDSLVKLDTVIYIKV